MTLHGGKYGASLFVEEKSYCKFSCTKIVASVNISPAVACPTWRFSLVHVGQALLFILIFIAEGCRPSSSPNKHSSSRSCSARDPLKPPRNQCLALEYAFSDCKDREQNMKVRKLNFCDHYSVCDVLSPEKYDAFKRADCSTYRDHINSLDKEVLEMYDHFKNLLEKYDCEETFAVNSCDKCKRAYKKWLCAVTLHYYLNGTRVMPCEEFCTQVEEKCPFFRPAQYEKANETNAGEPSFICKDPYIEQMNRSYGEPPCCYKPCNIRHRNKCAYDIKCDNMCVDYFQQYNSSLVTANATTSSAARAITPFSASITVFTTRLPSRVACALVQYMAIAWLVTTLIQYTTIGLT